MGYAVGYIVGAPVDVAAVGYAVGYLDFTTLGYAVGYAVG